MNSSSGTSDCFRISRAIPARGQRRAGAERALGRPLDHRTVGDRIGERHAEFDQVGAAAHQRRDQSGGAVGRRIAGGEIGDQRRPALLGPQPFEKPADSLSITAMSSSSLMFSR